MSDRNTADRNPPESQTWLVEEWARTLTNALESMTGEPPYVTFAPHELSAAEVDPGQGEFLWWEQAFSLGPDALLWAGAATRSWQEIANQVLRSAGVDDGDQETIRSTYLEIVSQSVSGVAGVLSARAGQDVSCLPGRSHPPPASETVCYSFEIGFGEAVIPVFAVFSGALFKAPGPAAQAAVPGQVREKSAKSTGIEVVKSNPIDLLLDVELPVSVSFGRAQLALKDVIKLTTGSIVELNRAVSEPVDVIVNNCVIARGEVVVVEGNFGIRIRQVISRQERLRTIY
jgi:flagellar motor switch protein FliN